VLDTRRVVIEAGHEDDLRLNLEDMEAMKLRLAEAADTLREAELAMVSRDLRNAHACVCKLQQAQALRGVIACGQRHLAARRKMEWAWRWHAQYRRKQKRGQMRHAFAVLRREGRGGSKERDLVAARVFGAWKLYCHMEETERSDKEWNERWVRTRERVSLYKVMLESLWAWRMFASWHRQRIMPWTTEERLAYEEQLIREGIRLAGRQAPKEQMGAAGPAPGREGRGLGSRGTGGSEY